VSWSLKLFGFDSFYGYLKSFWLSWILFLSLYELNRHLNEGFSSRFDPFCDNFLNTKYDIPNFQKTNK
jgi:hypothetical protein